MGEVLPVLNQIENNEFEITTNIGSWHYNPAENKFKWTNQFIQHLEIDSVDDELQNALDQLFLTEDILEIKKAFAKALVDKEGFTKKCKLKTKTDQIINVLITAVPIIKNKKVEYLIGSIHPHKSADRKDISLQDYQVMLDSFAILAQTDTRGKIVCCNENFCKISSYHKEELLGSDHRIVNSGHHSKEFFKDLWQTIRAGKTWTGEICNKNRYGDIYWVHTYITPLIKNGKIEAYMSLRFDITEKKLLAKQIERQNEEKAHFNAHLATLAELSVSIAHEINNPLTVIDTMSGFLKRDNKENTSISRAVDKI